jgi:hypothetical protein
MYVSNFPLYRRSDTLARENGRQSKMGGSLGQSIVVLLTQQTILMVLF